MSLSEAKMTAIPCLSTNPWNTHSATLRYPALVRLGRSSWTTFRKYQKPLPPRTPSILSVPRTATMPASSEPQISNVSPLSSLCKHATHPQMQRVSAPPSVLSQVHWVSNGRYSRQTRTLRSYNPPPKILSLPMPFHTDPFRNPRHQSKTPLC